MESRSTSKRRRLIVPPWWKYVVSIVALTISVPHSACAVTPDSPEVRKLIDSGLAYLEKSEPDAYGQMLGGRCLVGLAFLKAERRNHPRVVEAAEACRKALAANFSQAVIDTYSNGLAIIFLCEYAPERYAKEIRAFIGLLEKRQKPHGGWGYEGRQTGDTSQTQYGALSYWEAHRRGFQIRGDSLEGVADWLMRTQDPSGSWGYQGEVTTTSQLVPQQDTGVSMLAAGLGSAYICADILDASTKEVEAVPEGDDWELPESLRPVEKPVGTRAAPKIKARRVSLNKLADSIDHAQQWMKQHYSIDAGNRSHYYLYGLERFKSFQEAFEGEWEAEPQWYNDGYEYLKSRQAPTGEWSQYCGPTCDTAFSILFLLRSTQKSIRAGLGEGALLAGRGIPTDITRAKLRDGHLVVEQVHTKVEELLTMIDDGNEGVLDELARDPSQLVVDRVDDNSARRLQQLVRGGEPSVRLLAVRALARAGDMDYVPALIYALSDPDKRVVLEARDGLQFIARRFDGFGPPNDFTRDQQFDAIEAWKNWYKSLRPQAALDF